MMYCVVAHLEGGKHLNVGQQAKGRGSEPAQLLPPAVTVALQLLSGTAVP